MKFSIISPPALVLTVVFFSSGKYVEASGGGGSAGGELSSCIDITSTISSASNLKCSGDTVAVTNIQGLDSCPADGTKLCADVPEEDGEPSADSSLPAQCAAGQVILNLSDVFFAAPQGGPARCEPGEEDSLVQIIALSAAFGARFHVCPNGAECPNVAVAPDPIGFRHRVLKVSRDGTSDTPEEQEVLTTLRAQCGDYQFNTYLHVTNHLHALGTPSDEALQAGCPYFAVHAIVEDNKPAKKEVKIFETKEGFDQFFALDEQTMPFGSFPGNKIADAFFRAEAGNESVSRYDVIKNSCGNFIVSLASELDIRITPQVTSFVARRLAVSAGTDLVQMMRDSVFFSTLAGHHNNNKNRSLRAGVDDNESLLELLVESAASELMV